MSTGNEYQKHKKLQRPNWGSFGRNELAILGTTCSLIGKLTENISEALHPHYNLAYVDAEHGSKNSEKAFPGLLYSNGNKTQQFNFQDEINEYHIKSLFNERDLVLVNGNHYSANQQILVVDSRKSLENKQEQLTDIKMIVLLEQVGGIPREAKKVIGDFSSIPVYHISEIGKIAAEISDLIEQAIPSLSGLVLAGGKSTRMHTDKTVLEYHGKPQRDHLYELLDDFCDDTFISCRQEQADEIPHDFKCITDSFLGMGPMGALLSAFRQNPDTAWLSVACDLPHLSRTSLQYLADHRNPSKIATAFNSPDSSFPEPLITIWEPKSYPVLLHFLSLGYSCPRKVLINSDIEILEAPDPRELKNVNRPEEYEEAKEFLAASL
ncbi:MAG: NTP transferase domain-containing protein [Balneolaceae bacterium]|nr:NTP transferase domain-containing protein [Balneolaceae bacterium]